MYKRPTIDNNDAFDAGGMKWTMVTPFEELRVDYTGKVVLLDEPAADGRSEGGVHQQPVRRVRGAHHVHRPGPAQHVRRRARHPARDAGRGVRQGPLRAARRRHTAPSGSATEEWEIDGSRPARPLVGPALLAGARGTTAGSPRTSTPDFGFMASRVAQEGRPGHPRRLRLGGRAACTSATTSSISTETRGDEQLPRQRITGRAALVALRPRVEVHR